MLQYSYQRPVEMSVRELLKEFDKPDVLGSLCRSDKILEVAKNPWGEAAWYFEDTREQYRIGGTITVVGFENKDEALLKVHSSFDRSSSTCRN
jgi:pyridoxine/pyridoxamine 5'-phosphate oxidase